VVDEAHQDVLVGRAPVGEDVHSVTRRVGSLVMIFNAREHIGHKDVAFGSSMTVSTPPSSRILSGPHDVSQCRPSVPSVEQKYICPEIVENKVLSLFVRLDG